MTDVPFITDAVLEDTEANQPAAGVVGRWFLASDSGAAYRDNGSAWVLVFPRAGAGLNPAAAGPAGAFGYDSTQRRWFTWDGVQAGSFARTLNVPAVNLSDTLSAATIGTTETAFATGQLLAANYLIPRKAVLVTVTGQMTNSGTPPTLVLRLRLTKAGPTSVNLWESGAVAPVANLTDDGWGWSWLLQPTAAPGSAVSVVCGSPNSPHFGSGNYQNKIAQPVTVDTASAQTIQVTAQYSANTAGNSITLLQMLIQEFR